MQQFCLKSLFAIAIVFISNTTMFENRSKSRIPHIASEASYVYILSGQKLIKNAKNSQFGEFLKSEVGGQTVLPDMSILIGQKLVKKAKIQKFK